MFGGFILPNNKKRDNMKAKGIGRTINNIKTYLKYNNSKTKTKKTTKKTYLKKHIKPIKSKGKTIKNNNNTHLKANNSKTKTKKSKNKIYGGSQYNNGLQFTGTSDAIGMARYH